MRQRAHTAEERLWATLAHLCMLPVIMLPIYLLSVTGRPWPVGFIASIFIVYYSRKKMSPWMASQALQALAFQSLMFVLFIFTVPLTLPIPFTVAGIILIAAYFYAVMGAIRCAFGFNFRYPFIGSFIQRRLGVNEA
ncbi:MAG: DUF4870 domain-containing protein [Chloroflexi bacterium]|nr:DUF4870 domain-containing protein [Chloroflexota bacterium]